MVKPDLGGLRNIELFKFDSSMFSFLGQPPVHLLGDR